MAIENDIPKMTDSVATARRKMGNIMKFLDNTESSILDRNYKNKPKGGSAAPAPTKADEDYIKSLGIK
jgi:hypothetical protein